MRVVTFLLLFCSFSSLAQSIDTSLSNDRRFIGVAKSQKHGCMVWFTGQSPDVMTGFERYMHLRAEYNRDEAISKRYRDGEQIGFRKAKTKKNTKPSPVIVNVHSAKDNTISRVDITGSWYQLAHIFSAYWSKNISLDETRKTGKIASLNSFGDRVTLNYSGSGRASITITPNGTLKYKNYYHYPSKIARK